MAVDSSTSPSLFPGLFPDLPVGSRVFGHGKRQAREPVRLCRAGARAGRWCADERLVVRVAHTGARVSSSGSGPEPRGSTPFPALPASGPPHRWESDPRIGRRARTRLRLRSTSPRNVARSRTARCFRTPGFGVVAACCFDFGIRTLESLFGGSASSAPMPAGLPVVA